METTICAISTALGIGAISIIRISGPEAIKIVGSLFRGTDLLKSKSHTIHYGHIVDKDDKITDEVLISIMKGPKTFTTEDIVEINCHGGIACTNKVLELLLSAGCKLAEPGEFTKRAFLNGRIDLIEAEAISDMITSQTDISRKLAVNQITGGLSSMINKMRSEIGELLANIEVNIDYPEYNDIEQVSKNTLKPRLLKIKEDMKKLIDEASNGKIIKDGINVALVGKPNVGKSSLLNALANEEKAIVTDIAGTTRDLVEISYTIAGIKINLIDTAGIRKTTNLIEKIGIEKSKVAIKNADLVILVLDNSEKITEEDLHLIELIKEKEYIIFINKNDIENNVDLTKLPKTDLIFGNTKEVNGLESLKSKIADIFNLEKINKNDPTYISNSRQIALIQLAEKEIDSCLQQLEMNSPVDILAINIKNCWDYLGEITGDTYNDELMDTIFSKFCLGK